MKIRSSVVLSVLLSTILSLVNGKESFAKTNFSISAGYRCSGYKKTLIAPFYSYIYRDSSEDYYLNILLPNKNVSMRQINWFYDIDNPVTRPTAKKDLASEDWVQLYDIVGHFVLDGFINSIPISPMVYWDFSKKFRIGLGANLTINYLHHLNLSKKKIDRALLDRFAGSFIGPLKKFLSDKQSADLFKELVRKVPKSEMWQLEYVYEFLDPVADKDVRDNLKGVLDDKNIAKDAEVIEIEDGKLDKYIPQRRFHFTIEPFVLLGFKFLESSYLSGLVDITIIPLMIMCNSLTNFYIVESIRPLYTFGSYGFGLTLEKHISPYCSIFGRIGYSSYNHLDIKVGEGSEKLDNILPIGYAESWSVSIQCGVSFCSPDEERCPIYGCGIQVDHLHRAKKYRGSSMFTGKDLLKRKIFDGRVS